MRDVWDPIVPLQYFKNDILNTFKIITNKIININNLFINIKKEFSTFKFQLNYIDQCI